MQSAWDYIPHRQLLPQTMNSCRDYRHLANPRTPRKIQIKKGRQQSTDLLAFSVCNESIVCNILQKKTPAWILFPSAWGLTCCVFIIMIQTIFTTQCFYICLLPHSQLICIPNLYKGHFTGNMLLIFKVAKFAKVCVGLSHITHLYNNTSVEEHVVENAFE